MADDSASMAERIRQVFLARPDEDLAIDAVVGELPDLDRSAVTMALSGLSRRGFIHRTRAGVYRMASESEAARAQTRREQSATRADHAADGSTPRRAPRRRSDKLPELSVIGKLRNGRVLLEDGDGGLWSAARLVEEVAR